MVCSTSSAVPSAAVDVVSDLEPDTPGSPTGVDEILPHCALGCALFGAIIAFPTAQSTDKAVGCGIGSRRTSQCLGSRAARARSERSHPGKGRRPLAHIDLLNAMSVHEGSAHGVHATERRECIVGLRPRCGALLETGLTRLRPTLMTIAALGCIMVPIALSSAKEVSSARQWRSL